MDERTAFVVLEIESTKDENIIKQAYRKLLTKTNPEDNPEGFKRLRTAYETACNYARQQEETEESEELSPVDEWIGKVREIYESFSRRIEPWEWETLLDDEICQDLETGEEVKRKLFTYLMEHYRLPKEVWGLLDRRFFIEDERQQFIEQFPKNFVEFMIGQIHITADFPYHLFEGDDKADYDTFINQYFDLYDAVQEKNMELAGSLLDTLAHSGIIHPLVEMERLYMELSQGVDSEICERTKEILKQYPKEVRLLIPGATILWEAGDREEAVQCYEEILEEIPNHYVANRQLMVYYKEKGEYEKAKKRGEEIMKSNSSDPEVQKELVEINEVLIKNYEDAIEKQELDTQGYIDFGWCCLQNEKYQEGIETLLAIEPEEEKRTGYYSVLERLYLSDEQPENAEKMGYLWIEAIRKEEPTLEEEEKKYVPERIAAAYYIMARAWAQTDGKEEHALACFDKSTELFDGNEDAFLQKVLLLKKLHKNEEALEICNWIVQKNDKSFWAYVYRMEIYYEMRNGQGVIDNYNQAREIYPYYPPLYETAADTFEKYNQYKDALEVIERADKLEIKTPKLQYLRIRCRHMTAESKAEIQEVVNAMEKTLEELKEQGEREQSAEILAEGARCFGDLKEKEKALEYINQALEIREEPIYFWIKSSVLVDMENYKEALKCLEICEKDFPDGDRVFSRIGICHYYLNDLDKAVQYHKKTLEINGENDRANSDILDVYKIWLGNSRNIPERNRLYKEGLVYADRQIELRPEAYFYIERGLFHLEAGSMEAALADFAKAAEVEPDNVYAYHNMGCVYEQNGDYHKAMESYEKALFMTKPEQRLSTRAKMAECLKLMGRYQEAETYLLEYQKEYPDSKWAMRKLSELYCCMKEPLKASVWINQYCNKKQAEVYLEKAKMYMTLGDGEEAENYLKDLRSLDYKQAEVYLVTAQNYLYVLDNKRAALKAAKKALSLEKPGEGNYYRVCALVEEIYYRMGKLRRASSVGDLLRKSLHEKQGSEEKMLESADSRWWLYSLGESYYYQGDYERAEKYFAKILKAVRCKKCDMARCLDHFQGYALLYEARGESERALEYFEESLKENPLDLQGLYGRRRLKK